MSTTVLTSCLIIKQSKKVREGSRPSDVDLVGLDFFSPTLDMNKNLFDQIILQQLWAFNLRLVCIFRYVNYLLGSIAVLNGYAFNNVCSFTNYNDYHLKLLKMSKCFLKYLLFKLVIEKYHQHIDVHDCAQVINFINCHYFQRKTISYNDFHFKFRSGMKL